MHLSRAVLVTAIGATALWAQPVYHITDLGTLTGTTSSSTAISNNGLYVTGSFRNGTVSHAFSYSSSAGAIDLGTLGGSSLGYAINNTGQVAGISAPSTDHAFLYANGSMMDLGTIGGGTSESFGYGINNAGQVVGYSNISTSNSHQDDAFLYTGGSMQDLGVPSGASNSYADSINDNGIIVGYFTPDSATTHPFLLMNSIFTDLGTLAGTASGTTASAEYVSSNGLVTGSSNLANGNIHAFLYSAGTMIDLGTLSGTVSRGSGVNANGDVVGQSFWSGSGFHGFLYHNGAMLDVNNLLDSASSGYTITYANGISNNGVIAATGSLSGGASHALLLTPVSVSPQTITFDAIPNQILGVSPFAIAAEASSGLPVTFASTTPAVCTNASGLVMLLSAGPCSLTATQGGNVSFSAATAVVRSFTVTLGNPSGTLVSASSSPLTLGSGPRSVAVGDFNGDGKPDLVTANYGDGTVTVLIANNAAGFTAPSGSPFTVGTNPQSVAVGDFNGDGYLDIAVANSGSNNVTVLLGMSSGGFTALAGGPITVGTQPVSIVVGDFNGDGIQDLATANFASNNVTLLLGNGSGGFSAAVTPLPVGTNPISLAVADFNRDGFQDLAVANFGGGTVTVLLGSNAGTLTAATNSPFTVGNSPYSVAVGDFNGDGIPDIATANSGSNNVTVLRGDGLGGFTPFAQSPFTVGSDPYSLAVGDFNGDGSADLATANYGGGNVTLLLGNGSGAFTPTAGGAYATGAAPFALAAADFNNDGIQDLAVADSGAGNITVLLGGKVATTSSLTTTSPLVVALGQVVPLTLTVSDSTAPFATLSGAATLLDGNTGVATASQTTSPYTFSISSLAAGSHTLSASYGGDTRTGGSTSNSITLQVSATLTAQTISFGTLANQIIGSTPPALHATATSGLAVSFTSNTAGVCTLLGTAITLVGTGTCSITASQPGNGQYAPAPSVTQTFAVANLQTITFDAIPNQIFGVPPFMTAAKTSSGLPVTFLSTTPTVCSTASSLIALLKSGMCSITASQSGNANYGPASAVRSFTVSLGSSGAFTSPTGSPFQVGSNPNAAAVADFDGDGKLDLAVANQGSNNVTLLLGNGLGGFAPAAKSPFTVGAAPSAVAAGDFNGDGKADMAIANFNDGTVTVLLGDGLGGFNAAPNSPFTVGTQPGSISVGDFNDDGIQDLSTANQSDSTVTVLLGDGTGNFTAAPGGPFPGGSSANTVAVADFNGDGVQDLAIGDEAFAAGTVTILIGNGSGGFTAASYSPLSGGYLVSALALGDFNGDGIPDLATPSLIFNNAVVLLSSRSGGFTAATNSPFAVGNTPLAVVTGDFNGDGFVDMATANSSDGTVTLLLGNGMGGFTPAFGSPFMVGSSPSGLVVGDFNRDGIEDLAVTNSGGGSVTILLGGTISTTSVLSTSAASTIFVGQAVPLTLAVTDSATPFSPLAGSATFFDGNSSIGAASQNGTPYTFTANLAAGTHTLSATYNGGSGSAPSTSNSISILAYSRCDINRDQATNIQDLQLAINEALGVKPAADDLDVSGAVNVVDVQLIVQAIVNNSCLATGS